MPNTNPLSDENVTTSERSKNEEEIPEIDIMVLNDPGVPAETNTTITQRTIEIATAAVIVNNRLTNPVTFQLLPIKGNTNLNVLKAHKNIFSATKLIDPTLKIITFQNETIDTPDQLPSSAAEYTSKFKNSYKYLTSSRVHISHKIEFASPLGDIKYEKDSNYQTFLTL